MKRIICMAVVCGIAQSVLAQSPVPWSIAFETNVPVGATILSNANAGAWTGNGIAIVTNLDYSANIQSPDTGYPISGSHSNVLAFSEGTVSNTFDATGITEIWIDTMVQPVFQEDEPSTNLVGSTQMAIYFSSNNMARVWHGVMTNDPGDYYNTPDLRSWATLSNSTFSTIGSGKWVRVTIHMIHDTDRLQSFFTIRLNGSDEFTAPDAYQNASVKSGKNGKWFLCSYYDSSSQQLHSIGLSGSGAVDDLVVATNAVNFGTAMPYVAVAFVGNGSVTPSGTVTLTSNPGSTNFYIAPDTYYRIAAVYTGAVGGATGTVTVAQETSPYTLTWSNITANSTLFVSFAPQMAASNTPVPWMAGAGVFTNVTYPTWDDAALGDQDLDGMLTWQELIAGTQPTNKNSLLKIVSETFSNGVPRIAWLSSTGALAPYVIQLSTNLPGANWSSVSNNISATAGGTNEISIPAAPTSPAFYRVTITN